MLQFAAMEPTLDGYAELDLLLGDRSVPVYVWVSLCDGRLDDWGDCVNGQTGEPIAWHVVDEAFSSSGLSFDEELEADILHQAKTRGLLHSLPADLPARSAGPGPRKALPRSDSPRTSRRRTG